MSKTTKRVLLILAAVALLITILAWAGWQILTRVIESRSPIVDDPKVEAVAGSGLAGYWEGTLNALGVQQLRIQVRVEKTAAADGKLKGSFTSPDQSPQAVPLTACDETATTAHFAISVGSFKGTFNTDGSRLTGHWTQNALPLPLLLKRQSGPPKPPPRPQTPQPPYPYDVREITIENPADGVTLAGTLTFPNVDSRTVPAVILICGSGPHDRDETLFGHKPFLVLADHLTRQGIAVFRYDKRGIGKSTGNYATATSADFASDAAAVFAHLKTLPAIDPKRIGLCGHSEGSTIAFMLASENPDIAFVVSLAGVGVRMDTLLERQRADILKAMKQPQNPRLETLNREAIALAREQGDTPAARAAAEKILAKMGLPKAAAKAQLAQLFSPWMLSILRYEPRPTLEKVKCPVLALNGSKDTQVAADLNLPALRAGLEAGGGHPDITTTTLPGLNHLFQKCTTGAPAEYAKIEETLSPDALKIISDWIVAHESAVSAP